MTAREIVLDQIRHKDTPYVPWTIAFEEETHKQLDAYYGCNDWDKDLSPYIVHVGDGDTRQLKKIDDAFSEDRYGCVWQMDKKLWHIAKNPLPDPSFKNYHFPSPEEFTAHMEQHMPEFIENCNAEPDRFKIFDLGWGIYERAWMLRGFENALTDPLLEPEFYHELLGRITDIYVAMVKAAAPIPCDGILFGEDWGDQRGVIMGAELWRTFFKPCWKRVYDEVHKQGKIVMAHSCGSIYDIMEDVIEIGMDVYESVQPEPNNMDSFALKKQFGDRITFWGCLGTQSIIPQGTPEELKAHIHKLANEMSRGGGFILAPTKPLQEDTPLENALTVIEEFRSLLP